MTQETVTRIKLIAAEGMTLTNGETLGKEVWLGDWDSQENWREITDEEAAALQAAAERELEELLGDEEYGEQSVAAGD